jgi:hypothetical protein
MGLGLAYGEMIYITFLDDPIKRAYTSNSENCKPRLYFRGKAASAIAMYLSEFIPSIRPP